MKKNGEDEHESAVEKAVKRVRGWAFSQVIDSEAKIKALIEMANHDFPNQQLAHSENRYFHLLKKWSYNFELSDRQSKTPITL